MNTDKKIRDFLANYWEMTDRLGYEPSFDVQKGTRIILNPFLLLKQGIDETGFKKLCRAHRRKHKLLTLMIESTDKNFWTETAAKITQIELELQRLWGFSEDVKFHKFWDLPHCACPKLDNEDRYPIGGYIESDACPIHGRRTQVIF